MQQLAVQRDRVVYLVFIYFLSVKSGKIVASITETCKYTCPDFVLNPVLIFSVENMTRDM